MHFFNIFFSLQYSFFAFHDYLSVFIIGFFVQNLKPTILYGILSQYIKTAIITYWRLEKICYWACFVLQRFCQIICTNLFVLSKYHFFKNTITHQNLKPTLSTLSNIFFNPGHPLFHPLFLLGSRKFFFMIIKSKDNQLRLHFFSYKNPIYKKKLRKS